MALIAVRCECGHIGVVAASSLPRVLCCSRCDNNRLIREGAKIKSRMSVAEAQANSGEAAHPR